MDFENVEKITFESKDITQLGICLFMGCSNLKEIVFNSNIINVGIGCFINCSELKKIVLPNVNFIPQFCFAGCTSLTEISLG